MGVSYLFLCQSGFELFLKEEVLSRRGTPVHAGPGFVLAEMEEALFSTEEMGKGGGGLCFPHLVLKPIGNVRGEKVNVLTAKLWAEFAEACRSVRFEDDWPLFFLAASGAEGLGKRVRSVEGEFRKRLKEKMSRVSRLAVPLREKPGGSRGWAVFFADYGWCFFASEFWCGGQRRMADDAQAPSRSYLKVEEAYGILEREPGPGERVVDLGAAPGGWSYSAAKRGARVDAVDNGPLKGGAAQQPQIRHQRADGFTFSPAAEGYDWLFCDMVEDPYRILNLLEHWWRRKGCRHFIVNLKFGRTDPLKLLDALEEKRSGPFRDCATWRVRHLYHDREELTLVGSRESVSCGKNEKENL